jgi:purine-binding chemotaxis protein CheW
VSDTRVDLGGRAAALRHAFDRAFAEAPAPDREKAIELLAIGVGDDPYAIRLSEASGLFRNRPVTPLPTPVSALAGIAAFRGTLLAVYSLGRLLGHETPGIGPWLVIASGRVALAFDRFDGLLRAEPGDISEAPGERAVHGIVRTSGIARPILDLESISISITEQANAFTRGSSDDGE